MNPKTPVLLNLDLATEDVHTDEEIRAQLTEADSKAISIRATMFGAPKSPTGSHSDWSAAADAVFRMAHQVRRAARAQGGTPRVVVTGSAGLPLFVQLGVEVSGRVLDFSLLNRRQTTGQWDRLDFTPSEPTAAPGDEFFAVRDFRPAEKASGRVAVIVSTNAPRAPGAARLFLEQRGEAIAGEVEIRPFRDASDMKAVKFLEHSNAPTAAAELVELFNLITFRFPEAKGLSVFVDGPATLAFLVGRAIVLRRNLADVWVPSFHDGAYHEALRLPHRPDLQVFVIHDAEDRKLRERLDKTLVGARAQFWEPTLIGAGEPVDKVTSRRLDAAEVVVVLVTPNLVANATSRAMITQALAQMEAGRARVVPILVRKCAWINGLPALGSLQSLPASGKWLKNAHNDELWTEVDVALRKIVNEVRADLFGEEV